MGSTRGWECAVFGAGLPSLACPGSSGTAASSRLRPIPAGIVHGARLRALAAWNGEKCCVVKLLIAGGVRQRKGGSGTRGVRALGRAAGSGRALQRGEQCSALSRTLCPPWCLGHVPLPVLRTRQVLCHHSGARGPHPEVPSDVQHPEFSLLAGFPCVHAFPLGVSALALLFSPFFDLSPIHIFAFQVNVASWALGGASSTALLSATAVLLPSLIPLHLPQPCQASPASLTHLSLC